MELYSFNLSGDLSDIGKIGEKSAAYFLKKHGYSILETNFKNTRGKRIGEIDIIAIDNHSHEIVFVEVKTRNFAKYGTTLPEENITYAKLRKLNRISQVFLHQRKWQDKPHRFDAISVWIDSQNKLGKIKHLPHIYL